MAIKGIQDGLLITVPEQDGPEALSNLLELIDERADFFQGARLAVDVGNRSIGPIEMGKLRQSLAERDVTLWALLSSAQETRAAAADLGLEIELRTERDEAYENDDPIDSELIGDEATLIEQTVRSGQTLHFPGHVTVIGDVNPGSEIIAGGHIIVWGKLRGVVHAGANGNESARVCALDLSPTQLRIAGHIATSPEGSKKPQPEVALIREGALIAERWNPSIRS